MDSSPTFTSLYRPSTKSPSRATMTPPFTLNATTLPGRAGSSTNPRNFTGIGGNVGTVGLGGGGGGGGAAGGGAGGGGGAGRDPNPNGLREAADCSGTGSRSANRTGSGSAFPAGAPRPPAGGTGCGVTAGLDAEAGASVAASPDDVVYQTTRATRTSSPSNNNCRRCSAGLDAASFTARPRRPACATSTWPHAARLPGIHAHPGADRSGRA